MNPIAQKIPPSLITKIKNLESGDYDDLEDIIKEIKKDLKAENLDSHSLKELEGIDFNKICSHQIEISLFKLYNQILKVNQKDLSEDLFEKFDRYFKMIRQTVQSLPFGFKDPDDMKAFGRFYYAQLANKVAEVLKNRVERLEKLTKHKDLKPVSIKHNLYEYADLFDTYACKSKISSACLCFKLNSEKDKKLKGKITAREYAKTGYVHIVKIYISLVNNRIEPNTFYKKYEEVIAVSKLNLQEDCDMDVLKAREVMFKSMANELNALYNKLFNTPEGYQDINIKVKKLKAGLNKISGGSEEKLHYSAKELSHQQVCKLHFRKATYCYEKLVETGDYKFYQHFITSMKSAEKTFADFKTTPEKVQSLVTVKSSRAS